MSSSATRAASIALGGVLADLVGIRAVYALGGGVLILAGVIGLSRLRRRDLVPSVVSTAARIGEGPPINRQRLHALSRYSWCSSAARALAV